MKWKNFLVPLWAVFVFKKIKNKALQNGFFSQENAVYRKGGAIIINSAYDKLN